MTIGSVSNTNSFALTDKDRKMIDDLLVNKLSNDGDIDNYDDLAAALSDSNTIVTADYEFSAVDTVADQISVDFGHLLDVRV